MCGIFSTYSKRNNLSKEIISNALSYLKHRGPDASSVWISEDKKVGLAHARLSIIDLNQISMPISNEDNTVFVIANGEFYDHMNIRNNLIKRGHRFKTDTDTEIVLHLYEEKGINCLEDLRGEFAFIIYDINARTLFVVRDRFGIKPLYYSHQDGDIHFSSEIPALIKSGVVKTEWDLLSLFNYSHINLHSERTLFKNISQVPPGHYMVVNEYGSRTFQYWDADFPPLDSDNIVDENETKEQLHDLLMESVDLRLNSDVPIACYLSGGLDSSTLLGLSSRIAGKPLDAFTISFDDKKVDESPIAERTARHIGSKLHTLLIKEDDIVSNFEKAVLSACSPMANAAGVARYLLSDFTSKNGYKVVLSGEGADEVFFGYNYMTWEALSDPKNVLQIADIENYRQAVLAQFPVDRSCKDNLPDTIQSVEKILGYIPKWVESQAFFNASHRKLLSEDVVKQYSSFNPYLDYFNNINVKGQMQNRDRVVQSAYLWIKSFFPNNMLNWIGDRAEMAHSIEARLPFLDHVLFDKLKHIPTSLKIKDGIEKHILREMAKPYISEEIYKREKFIFQAPPMQLAKTGQLFHLMCDSIISNIDNLYMYDKRKVLAFIDQACNVERSNWVKYLDVSTTLTTMASIAILERGYKMSK